MERSALFKLAVELAETEQKDWGRREKRLYKKATKKIIKSAKKGHFKCTMEHSDVFFTSWLKVFNQLADEGFTLYEHFDYYIVEWNRPIRQIMQELAGN